MRVPYSWIASYLPQAPPASEAAQILSRQGLLVERQEDVGLGLDAVRVVQVDAIRQLAGRLQVATVSGAGLAAEVVTGAANVRMGAAYAWAPPGTVLPDGRVLEQATFAGQASAGMLLSAKEAGLGDEADQLLELPAAAVGQSLSQALGLPEVVFELDLTPNLAGFCQHVIGVAEELAAGLGRRLSVPTLKLPTDPMAQRTTVEPSELAPTYLLASLAGPPGLASPLWLRRRLWDAGLRSHNLYVDVTNYVTLAWGQPLHAFDLGQIEGEVRVRLAEAGESIVTLDGIARQLEPEDIVIADDSGALNIAGILGGLRGSIREQSTQILIEAAAFDAQRIRQSFRRLGLPTEAALRFQRGVDRSRTEAALADALAILAAAGAGPAKVLCRIEAPLPGAQRLEARPERVAELLGYPVGETQIANCLNRLGLETSVEGEGLVVLVPDRRRDITTTADLAEEVGRLIGYDQIPESVLPSRQVGAFGDFWELTEEVRHWLLGLGLSEHWGNSLLSESEVSPFGEAVALSNPLSVEEAWLRPALCPSLLKVLRLNASFRNLDLRLFELGRVFSPHRDAVQEEDHLAGLITGGEVRAWTGPGRPADLFTGKGVLLALAERLHVPLTAEPGGQRSFLHPHRQFTIRLAGQELGYLGELHPTLLPPRLQQAVVVWELALTPMTQTRHVPKAVAPARQPTTERDLAVVVPEEVDFADVEAALSSAGANRLGAIELFDLYRGPQLPAGQKSLALRLTFADPERTLTEGEVAADLTRINQALARIGGDLRQR